jgi:hypothetical protein
MSALINELLELLRAQPLVKSVRVINYDETPTGKSELKVRCQLIQNYQFQIWLHDEPSFRDYAYQLFTDRPILRWDNAPHYPRLATAPHHFHDQHGNVSTSELVGDTLNDLRAVLSTIEQWIAQTSP